MSHAEFDLGYFVNDEKRLRTFSDLNKSFKQHLPTIPVTPLPVTGRDKCNSNNNSNDNNIVSKSDSFIINPISNIRRDFANPQKSRFSIANKHELLPNSFGQEAFQTPRALHEKRLKLHFVVLGGTKFTVGDMILIDTAVVAQIDCLFLYLGYYHAFVFHYKLIDGMSF
jgi:hypothetical protein